MPAFVLGFVYAAAIAAFDDGVEAGAAALDIEPGSAGETLDDLM